MLNISDILSVRQSGIGAKRWRVEEGELKYERKECAAVKKNKIKRKKAVAEQSSGAKWERSEVLSTNRVAVSNGRINAFITRIPTLRSFDYILCTGIDVPVSLLHPLSTG